MPACRSSKWQLKARSSAAHWPYAVPTVMKSTTGSGDMKGIPAPRAARIRLTNPGTPQDVIATDKLGHGLGGVRTPYIDVPDAVYFTNSPGPGTCREIGHKVPFDTARIIELYGTRQAYVN